MKNSKQKKLTNAMHRRSFLGSASALISLPFLESVRGGQLLNAATATGGLAPKRMVFLGMGFGVTEKSWYPNKHELGSDYTLPKVLKPLLRHQSDMTIVQNLQHQWGNGHSGSTFWLTGANQHAIPGQSFHNTVSVDQVAAETLGANTRFTSIQLAATNASADGHGTGLSLAWNRYGKPVAGYNTPLIAYHRLFSDDKTPLAQRKRMLAEQRSVLDTVMSDYASVKRKVNQHDRNKLDEYFHSVRDIETRLSKEERWMSVDKKRPADMPREPGAQISGADEIEMMYDLMVAAMQVDASRVFTYRMPVSNLLTSLKADVTAHNMSHYSEGDGGRQAASELRDTAHAKLLAGFFDKLKQAKNPDGTSLFDSSVITFGSQLRSKHSLTNCPTLVAGGGAGIKQGRHLVMEDTKTPLCNMWLSLLQGMGLPAESFGDSTGVIKALFEA